MGLAAVTDALAAYLESAVSPAPALVGSRYPTVAGDLPAVVLSFDEVVQKLASVGRLPAQSESGALPVTTSVDLADPVATFPDATVLLLSIDRLTLTLPHGPLVAADGTTTTFGPSDLEVSVGATSFTVVDGTPTAGQVQPDPGLGVLHFGAALPAAGTLTADYFVGEWEVRVERYSGSLLVETFATDAAGVDTLSRSVETALLDPPGAPLAGLRQIDPTSWQAIAEAGTGRAGGRGRALAFAFDFELVRPQLGAGGGLIDTVSVSVTVDATPPTEHFDVQPEGSTP
jgi:hypothetical protein